MEKLLSNQNRIILVVDQDYYPLILNFKNSRPHLNIKVINRNQLIDKAGYRFSKDPLPYLIKEKRISYNKAKRYLNLLKLLRESKDNELNELKENLKDYLTIDEYGIYELEQYDIYLLEMDEDREIQTLLSRHSLDYSLVHLSDLGIEESQTLKEPNIIYFSNKFAQFSHIFSEIRQKIEEDESIKDHIVILCENDNDLFYIYTISSLFNIDVYSLDKVPVLANPFVSRKVNEIYQNKSLKVDNDEDGNYTLLINLIKQYQLDEIDDFEYAYANLLEILSSQKETFPHGDKGILITTRFAFDNKDIIYVTNFRHGCFYQEYSDNNVLPDSALAKMGLLTSYDKTALDERKKLNYLKYNNIDLLSRVKQHLEDSIYDSQFISSLNLKGKIKEIKELGEVNINGLFTDASKLIMDAHRYDSSYFKEKHKEYRSYDHSYKKINANSLMVRKSWSVTNLEKYRDCPFKYLLDTLIPLPGDMHHAYRGTFIHSIFETILHDDFDFEKAYEEAKKEYISYMNKMNEPFTKKEEAWLRLYHDWLKEMIPTLLRGKEHMNIIDTPDDFERKIYYEIDGYKFEGTIDKLIYTQNGDDYYYTIVDYKTGAESYKPMEIAVGKSIQLPLYYYAVISQKKPKTYTKDAYFGGILIQHPFFKTIKDAYVDKGVMSEARLIFKTKYAGICLGTESYLSSFDDTTSGGEKGTFLDYSLTFTTPDDDSLLLDKPPLGVDVFNLNDVVELSKKATVDIIKSIINNEFPIAPSPMDITKPYQSDNNGLRCQWCSHRDICYVNPLTDAMDYSGIIRKEIIKKARSKHGQ